MNDDAPRAKDRVFPPQSTMSNDRLLFTFIFTDSEKRHIQVLRAVQGH